MGWETRWRNRFVTGSLFSPMSFHSCGNQYTSSLDRYHPSLADFSRDETKTTAFGLLPSPHVQPPIVRDAIFLL
jgi:hypothetical protein